MLCTVVLLYLAFNPTFDMNRMEKNSISGITKRVACLLHSGLDWKIWSPHPHNPLSFKTMSTCSFAYEPAGFSSRCDWVVGNRYGHYSNFLNTPERAQPLTT